MVFSMDTMATDTIRHTTETGTRHLCKSSGTRTKNITQVHHSFLHQNNSPANHVARFVSHAAVSVTEYSCVLFLARNWCQKKLVPDWPTHVQVSGTRRRLVPVCGACVAGFSLVHVGQINDKCWCCRTKSGQRLLMLDKFNFLHIAATSAGLWWIWLYLVVHANNVQTKT